MLIFDQKPSCPISSTKMDIWMSIPIDYRDGNPIKYGNIYKSPDSGYAQVFPVPEPEIISSFYKLDQYYTHQLKGVNKSNQVNFWDKLRFKLAYMFQPKTPSIPELVDSLTTSSLSSILEIGCGSGQLLEELKNSGYQVQGIEPDSKAAAFDRDLDVKKGMAENLPEIIKNQKFDLVIMSHVLEHCHNPLEVLTNIYNSLNPNGYFICEVPNNNCLGLNFSGSAWLWLDIPRHLNFFTEKSLKNICEKVGFEPSNVYYKGYARQFGNSWINQEARIYDTLVKSGESIFPEPIRNSPWRAWKLLLATLFASPEKKCDSVLLVASKEPKKEIVEFILKEVEI